MKREIECSFAWNVMRIIPNTEIVTPTYFNCLMNSPSLFQEMKKNESGSGMGFIPKNVLRNISFPLPSTLQEQTNIAKTLSDTDELISSLEKLISKKRNLKQGAMQQLLTGKKRLPGFSGDWGKETVGDMITFIGGSQPPLSTFIFSNKIGYLRLLQIRDYKTDKYETYISKALAKRFCSSNDIMIGRYGPPIFQILRGLEGSYNVALIKAIPKTGLHNDFMYHFLKQEKLFLFIELLSRRSSGQTGVDLQELRKYPMSLPPSFEEQTAIAQILSDMDSEIEVLEKKRDKYYAIKQGMMQELLTGKIRLV
jgi:type I restriction enzyme S subunit